MRTKILFSELQFDRLIAWIENSIGERSQMYIYFSLEGTKLSGEVYVSEIYNLVKSDSPLYNVMNGSLPTVETIREFMESDEFTVPQIQGKDLNAFVGQMCYLLEEVSRLTLDGLITSFEGNLNHGELTYTYDKGDEPLIRFESKL